MDQIGRGAAIGRPCGLQRRHRSGRLLGGVRCLVDHLTHLAGVPIQAVVGWGGREREPLTASSRRHRSGRSRPYGIGTLSHAVQRLTGRSDHDQRPTVQSDRHDLPWQTVGGAVLSNGGIEGW